MAQSPGELRLGRNKKEPSVSPRRSSSASTPLMVGWYHLHVRGERGSCRSEGFKHISENWNWDHPKLNIEWFEQASDLLPSKRMKQKNQSLPMLGTLLWASPSVFCAGGSGWLRIFWPSRVFRGYHFRILNSNHQQDETWHVYFNEVRFVKILLFKPRKDRGPPRNALRKARATKF